MTSGDPRPKYTRATFTEPTPYGYIYAGMRIDPPGHAPFVRKSEERNDVLVERKRLARRLEALPEVIAATVYGAALIPPTKGNPRFDVMLLIQTTTPETIATVQAAEAYQDLDADFVMSARNVRHIGNMDDSRSGTFLFNHFSAADSERALETWENIAGWFTSEADVDDSALLQPIEEAPYALVNHVRLPRPPLRFLLEFAKPSFRRYVGAELTANQVGVAPVICRTA